MCDLSAMQLKQADSAAEVQVQLASLDLQASRLVRTTTASGRGTFGDASEVVSARCIC